MISLSDKHFPWPRFIGIKHIKERNCRMKVRNGEIILWKLSSRFKEPELKEN